MLGSAHDADDAVQEALLRAWRGLARFEGRSALRTWLYGGHPYLPGPGRCPQKVPARTQRQTLRTIDDTRTSGAGDRVRDRAGPRRRRALVALLTEDVTRSMPPLPRWYHGIAAVTDFAVQVPMTRCPAGGTS